MPNYLIGYLSFSALEHIRKYPASFIKSIHRYSMAKIDFFFDTLTKTMDKNKGRPISLPMKVSVDIVLTQYSVYV